MTLTQLRYFLAVIKAGSISGASTQIHVAQPAISQRLKQLEAELGQELFHRLPRGIELTPAGHRLKTHALEILKRIDAVHDDFLSSEDNPMGQVALAMSTAVNSTFCVPVLERVHAKYPNIRVTLVESMSGTLLEWAEKGRVDIAVVYDTPANTSLFVQYMGSEHLYLVSAPDAFASPPARTTSAPDVEDWQPMPLPAVGDALPLREIANLPLILPGFPQTLRLMIEKIFTGHLGHGPKTFADVDSTYAIKKLVAAGKGHSILSVHSVGDEVARGELILTPITEPAISRTVNLVTNPVRRQDAAVNAVQRIVHDVISSGLRAAPL